MQHSETHSISSLKYIILSINLENPSITKPGLAIL